MEKCDLDVDDDGALLTDKTFDKLLVRGCTAPWKNVTENLDRITELRKTKPFTARARTTSLSTGPEFNTQGLPVPVQRGLRKILA